MHAPAAAGDAGLAALPAERGGAEHRHTFDFGRGSADAMGDGVRFGRIFGGNDDRREAPERRHRGLTARLRLGGIEAWHVARHQGGDHRRVGIVGLDKDTAGFVGAAGAAGDLLDLLEAALGGAQVAPASPRSASTTPTSVRFGK